MCQLKLERQAKEEESSYSSEVGAASGGLACRIWRARSQESSGGAAKRRLKRRADAGLKPASGEVRVVGVQDQIR